MQPRIQQAWRKDSKLEFRATVPVMMLLDHDVMHKGVFCWHGRLPQTLRLDMGIL